MRRLVTARLQDERERHCTVDQIYTVAGPAATGLKPDIIIINALRERTAAQWAGRQWGVRLPLETGIGSLVVV